MAAAKADQGVCRVTTGNNTACMEVGRRLYSVDEAPSSFKRSSSGPDFSCWCFLYTFCKIGEPRVGYMQHADAKIAFD
jgi:hypothetical protein